MLKKISKALADPAMAAYFLRDKVDPRGLWLRYGALARRVGLDRLYFVLSFDCDIEDDIRVVWEVHTRLANMGAKPVYAVPGELLERGEAVYRRILEAGGEFINHGYTEHTYYDTERSAHASCFFYDQLPLDTVRGDIVNGDRCLKEVLGVEPRGFRAPHFGTFQKEKQLSFMHSVLSELGYAFSTSTTPLYAFRKGPIFRDFGVREIPVSGMGSSPLTILDTWGCFMAPGRSLGPDDYYMEGVTAAESFGRAGVGILNYYADPSHIYDQDIFFKTVEKWLAVATPVTYRELLENMQCNIVS